MPHQCCPQTMTPENLGVWLSKNSKNNFTHDEEVELTDEQVSEYEKKSSLASRALDRLKLVEDTFKHYIKNGTPPNEQGEALPFPITIPPTSGTKVLKANREFADKILEDGFIVNKTPLFTIPDPDNSLMVVVDQVGSEWPDYTKAMTEVEAEMYGNLFKQEADGKMRKLETDEVSVNKHSGAAEIKTKKRKTPEAFI